jgi:hypothetical protein
MQKCTEQTVQVKNITVIYLQLIEEIWINTVVNSVLMNKLKYSNLQLKEMQFNFQAEVGYLQSKSQPIPRNPLYMETVFIILILKYN